MDAFEVWLSDARACGVRAIETFAAGLEQDGAAVRAALTEPWSNGQAEGQITRLKLIKRTMYGRAGFDLFRRRPLIHAKCGRATKVGESHQIRGGSLAAALDWLEP